MVYLKYTYTYIYIKPMKMDLLNSYCSGNAEPFRSGGIEAPLLAAWEHSLYIVMRGVYG